MASTLSGKGCMQSLLIIYYDAVLIEVLKKLPKTHKREFKQSEWGCDCGEGYVIIIMYKAVFCKKMLYCKSEESYPKLYEFFYQFGPRHPAYIWIVVVTKQLKRFDFRVLKLRHMNEIFWDQETPMEIQKSSKKLLLTNQYKSQRTLLLFSHLWTTA